MDRKELERLLEAGRDVVKYRSVKMFLDEHKGLADYHYLYNKLYSTKKDKDRMIRIAVLSSFTVNQIKEVLAVETYKYGISSDVYICGYNQYKNEILDPKSAFYKFQPDIVILAVRIEDLIPEFYQGFLKMDKDAVKQYLDKTAGIFDNLISTIKGRIDCKIIINNFSYPYFLESGISDFQNRNGQIEWIDYLNRRLIQSVNNYTDTFIFNLKYYLYLFGWRRAYDDRMWFLARNPFKIDFIIECADRYSQFIKTILGKRKKCLVLDLDNTLWGGIVGEDGINGIKLGHDYPGNVYREIQSIIKQYSHQGAVLALNSKNNLDDVKEVFDAHPDMVLNWDDFAAVRINWNSKIENMKELAEEMNIGTDSFVFVDDSPFELEMIREIYPEIETVKFKDDVLYNLELIKNINSFQNLYFTKSDLEKTQQYKEQTKRNELKLSAASIEDFYKGLEMKSEIRLCDPYALRRVSQLTQKTNQFNLTTRRYSESDIEKFMHSPEYKVYYLRLRDRCGDNGIVGAIVIQQREADWHIDTFLLSCRVIGRTVETAFLSFIQNEARRASAKNLIGEYIATDKNRLVEDLYQKHHFIKREDRWILDASKKIVPPPWIEFV